jgi:hypothetical protein
LFVFVNFYEFLISSLMILVIFSSSKTMGWRFPYYEILVITFYFGVKYLRHHIILYKNEISHKS